MAISELKQRLLIIELAKIGYRDAQFSEKHDALLLDPKNERMPKIQDNGDIHFGSEYDHLVRNQLQPIVDRVNEIAAAWDRAQPITATGLERFKILTEYNNVVLAARDDSAKGFGYGFHFTTWDYGINRASFNNGHYTNDFEYAKQDFALRCGLIDRSKLFTENEMKLIRQGLVFLGANSPDLTYEQNTLLGKVVEKIEVLVPAIEHREEWEHEGYLPDDGLDV